MFILPIYLYQFPCFCILILFFNLIGTYIDKKCPFTGNVSIRGRILSGTCHSAKMNKTLIVRRNYLHFIKKYQRYSFPFLTSVHSLLYLCATSVNYLLCVLVLFRYEKRHSNIPAHVSPCFRVKEGDHVIIGQCRLDHCRIIKLFIFWFI